MNANSGSESSGTFIWGLVAGFVVVFGAGALYLSGIFGGGLQEQAAPDAVGVAEPETVQQDDEQVADVPKPAEETPAETADAEPESEEISAPSPAAPVLDQIFVESDGNALLSGNAEPGVEVVVLLDGETVHSFVVDSSGQFAEFVAIPFADAARGLVLETRGGDAPARSDDYLIAALPAPPAKEETAPPEEAQDVDVAEAETTAEAADEIASATATAEEVTEDPELSTTEQAEAEPEPQREPEEEQPEIGDAPDQQVAILRSGEEGVELVQPPTVQDTPPKQIALDTIGYSDSGDVELTGRAQDGSAVRLYLDNRLVADLPPAADGQWRGAVEGIDPGVYTLRVDEVAPDGTVVSRIETPFKREPVEVLRAAEAAGTGDTTTNTAPIRSVTVQKGDTLWAISRERYGDGVLYVKLFDANRNSIRDPDLIYPGQIFTIPE